MLGGSKRSLVCKLMMMMLLLTHLAFSGENAFSQQSITVRFEQQSLSEVLNVLKQKTGYEFLYNDEEIKGVTGITRSFSNASLQEILKSCLTGTKYTFKIVDNLIVITPDNKKDEVKKVTVQGKVVDDRGEILPGVTVLLKGTAVGVVTDIDGKFKIELPKQDTLVLIFSFVGMKSHEVDVNKIKDLGKEIFIKMLPDTEDLEEVVVTGYANVKKESFTGSSISVKREDLLKASPTNVVQALASFDPSFRIQKSNIWGSDPNALPEFNIRGESSIAVNKGLDVEQQRRNQRTNLKDNPNMPVFILDGFEVSVEKIYDMDLVLYVCNGGFWHLNDIYRNHSIIKKMTASLSVICNMCSRQDASAIAALLNCSVYHFPYDSDMFKSSVKKETLIQKLLELKGGASLSDTLKGYLRKSILHHS